MKTNQTITNHEPHETHFACQEIMERYGGKAIGCCCSGHKCKSAPIANTDYRQLSQQLQQGQSVPVESLSDEKHQTGKITCLSLSCPERKSLCCGAISKNDKGRFICSKCGLPFVGGECSAIKDGMGWKEIDILNYLRRRWGKLFALDTNDSPTWEVTVEVADFIRQVRQQAWDDAWDQGYVAGLERSPYQKEIDEAKRKAIKETVEKIEKWTDKYKFNDSWGVPSVYIPQLKKKLKSITNYKSEE